MFTDSEERPTNQNIEPSANFGIVTIASSAGGIAPLMEILGALPANFAAPILVVQHLSPMYPSSFPELLARNTKLRVKFANEGERLRPGTVYVARPNVHLVVSTQGEARLSSSARVCFTRPAADPLFASAALYYKERMIAVVLSGRGQDGAMGTRVVAGVGGVTIAQQDDDCQLHGMPQAASETGCVNFRLPARRIADALISLVMIRGAVSWLHVPLPIG